MDPDAKVQKLDEAISKLQQEYSDVERDARDVQTLADQTLTARFREGGRGLLATDATAHLLLEKYANVESRLSLTNKRLLNLQNRIYVLQSERRALLGGKAVFPSGHVVEDWPTALEDATLEQLFHRAGLPTRKSRTTTRPTVGACPHCREPESVLIDEKVGPHGAYRCVSCGKQGDKRTLRKMIAKRQAEDE